MNESMTRFDLRSGKGTVQIHFDEDRIEILGTGTEWQPISDIEIGRRLDHPVDSPPIEDIVKPGETVLLVVPDATRQIASGQIINLLVRRLIANGTAPNEIAAIFATGIHRSVSVDEMSEILTPFIAQRIRCIQHDARNPVKLFSFGHTSNGIPVDLNWALTEFDHIVLVGGVTFHYFAGFTGGRKLICPGLASQRTITATHKLAFDCATLNRRKGVGPGMLTDNAVHEAFVEAASKVAVSFGINTIVSDTGAAADVYCGNWITSHSAACDRYAADRTIVVDSKREFVVVSCGGSPYDINMIQAHKALESAAPICADGGTIFLIADCRDGLGHDDFLSWFDAGAISELAEKLCENYTVNGQTAWSLKSKTAKFDVRVLTSLDGESVRRMGMKKFDDLESEMRQIESDGLGYVLPFGAKYLYQA